MVSVDKNRLKLNTQLNFDPNVKNIHHTTYINARWNVFQLDNRYSRPHNHLKIQQNIVSNVEYERVYDDLEERSMKETHYFLPTNVNQIATPPETSFKTH